MNDSFDLQRFVDAQATVYRRVVEELSGMHDTPETPSPAPDIAKAIPTVKTVAGQYHLTGQIEIAGPIEAPIMSSIPWVICMRAAAAPPQTYAIFFKADTFVSARMSTLGDHCDAQSYRPLPN